MSKPKTIAAEILAASGHTFKQIAEMLELSPSYPYKLASGEKPLDNASREVRCMLLNFALAIPEKSRSAELDEWIARTQKHFQEKPLGGAFI